MRLNKEQEEALSMSIKNKWMPAYLKGVKLKSHKGGDFNNSLRRIGNCKLCMQFVCKECPICIKTGRGGCLETPLDEIDTDRKYPPYHPDILAMLKFLINLFPVKKRLPFNKQIK